MNLNFSHETLAVTSAVICGVLTFLMRWLPLRHPPQRSRSARGRAVWSMLSALGPAAITALLVVSVWPSAEQLGDAPTWMALGAGLGTVWLVKRFAGGIALPTLLAALVYGACRYFLTAV
jgi:branched-subunit amino acid transport protein